jgi:trans-aconitate methyltransferase
VRETARHKFEAPPRVGLDLLARCASDPPLAVTALGDAARPARAGNIDVCELRFGDGWLLEELTRTFPEANLFGLDQPSAYVLRLHSTLGDSVRVVRGDMEALPFADRSFDVILTCSWCAGTTDHLLPPSGSRPSGCRRIPPPIG